MSYQGIRTTPEKAVKEYIDNRIKECCDKIKPIQKVVEIGNHRFPLLNRPMQSVSENSIYKSYNGKTNTFGTTLIL